MFFLLNMLFIVFLVFLPITAAWVRARLCRLQKRVHSTHSRKWESYQLLVHGRWFSPGTPAYSTTKTGRHDIVEIVLKLAFSTKNQIKSNQIIEFQYWRKQITLRKIIMIFEKDRITRSPTKRWFTSGIIPRYLLGVWKWNSGNDRLISDDVNTTVWESTLDYML